MKPLPPLEALLAGFARLPGVGPKTAQRYALHLLQHDRPAAEQLAAALTAAAARISNCSRCNAFTDHLICATCSDPARDPRLLAVIESPADQAALEASLSFTGYYYVLMGRISPLDGITPNRIGLDRLLVRATDGIVTELIIATNFTAEGEATAHMIASLLKPRGLKITRLARGIPFGGELEYVDLPTLALALRERRTSHPTDQ